MRPEGDIECLVKPKGSKSFRRQFFELWSGSSAAQLISLLMMPIVSRLYSPAQMGEFALYYSLSSIVGLVSNLRLDLPIILASDDAEAERLAWTAGALTTTTTVIAALILTLVHSFVQIEWLSPLWITFTLITIFASGILQILVNWHSRNQNYGVLGVRSATERLLVLAISIGFGYWGFTQFGLIAGQTVGVTLSAILLFTMSRLRKPNFSELSLLIKKYRDFPTKHLPSSTLTVLAVHVVSFLFGSAFSVALLGQFNLAMRVLEAPVTLVGNTFSTVYYQYTSRHSTEHRKILFFKSIGLLAAIFLPPLALIVVYGPELFSTIFGVNWLHSGQLARWLAPMVFFRILYISQSSVFVVQRRLGVELLVSAILVGAQILGFAVGYWGGPSLDVAVSALSVFASISYVFALTMMQRVLSTSAQTSA